MANPNPSDSLVGFAGPVEDRLAIHELNLAYGDAVTRHDLAVFRTLFADDAVWTHPEVGSRNGGDAIAGLIAEAFAAYPMVVLTSAPGALRVDGDRAEGRVFIEEVVTTADGGGYRCRGRYLDRYVRHGGRWLYARRDYALLHKD